MGEHSELLERIRKYRNDRASGDTGTAEDFRKKILDTEIAGELRELLAIANEALKTGIDLRGLVTDMESDRLGLLPPIDANKDKTTTLTAVGMYDPTSDACLRVNNRYVTSFKQRNGQTYAAIPTPDHIERFLIEWPVYQRAFYARIEAAVGNPGKPEFDAGAEAEHIKAWIRGQFEKTAKPGTKAVIGISGGKDSTVCAKLLVDALGADRVIGVLMPNGIQPDIEDSKKVVGLLGIKAMIVDIKQATDGLRTAIEQAVDPLTGDLVDLELSEDAEINMPPRVRMATLYAVAQSVAKKYGGRVCNTCNLSEDWIGYSTKYGDSAGDFAPLAEYTVTEVLAIGKYLGLPDELIFKTPSDGLCGKSDEDKIGFKYAVLDAYIRTGICEDPEIRKRIDWMHMANLHKLKRIPSCARLAA